MAWMKPQLWDHILYIDHIVYICVICRLGGPYGEKL